MFWSTRQAIRRLLIRLNILLFTAIGVLTGCDNEAARVPERWTEKAAPVSAPVPPRWFRDDQVRQGEALYRTHCAECHGQEAQGAANWRDPGSDGRFPPPPLNGSGHAWHHSVEVLYQVIMRGIHGSEKSIASWQDKLTQGQAMAIIAWFQSLWSDTIYTAWYEGSRRGG